MQGKQSRPLFIAQTSMHMGVIRSRRAKLNRHLIFLTLANMLIWLCWRALSSAHAPHSRLALGLCMLTMLTWLWLLITLHRRFQLWNTHERRRGYPQLPPHV
jgi:hypothetical protein